MKKIYTILLMIFGVALIGACGGEPGVAKNNSSTNSASTQNSTSNQSTNQSSNQNTHSGTTGTNNLKDLTSPEVLSIAPTDNETGVEPQSEILVVFNEAMDPLSFTNEGIQLSQNGTPTSFTFTVDNPRHSLTIKPEISLTFSTQYTLTLGDSILDLAGNPLVTKTSTFSTRSRAWTEWAAVELEGGEISNYQAVQNKWGDIMAVWIVRNPDVTYHLWVNYFVYSTRKWGEAQLVDMNQAFSPSVDADDEGNFFLIWYRLPDGLPKTIWTRFYGTEYIGPIEKLADAGIARGNRSPQIRFDSKGNALATWLKITAVNVAELWSSYYTKGGGWQAPKRVASGTLNTPQLTMAGDKGHVVWDDSRRSIRTLKASRFNASSQRWSSPQPIVGDRGISVTFPYIMGDKKENVTVVWEQNGDLWSNRFTKARGWGTAQTIENQPKPLSSIATCISSKGDIVASWIHDADLMVGYFTAASSSWEIAKKLQDNLGSKEDARVGDCVFDNQGRVLITWTKHGASTQSYFSLFEIVTQTWTEAKEFNSPSLFRNQLFADDQGKIISLSLLQKSLIFNQFL